MATADLGEKVWQLHQDFVLAYKERFNCENKSVAGDKASPMWKSMRQNFKDFRQLQNEVHKQIDTWKREAQPTSIRKGTLQSLWRNYSKKGTSVLATL